MKKILLMVSLLILVSGVTFGQELRAVPRESGILTFYDFPSHAFYLGTRYPLLDWKGMIYLDAVAITDFSSLNGGLGISFDMLKTSEAAGLTFHLPDKLNVGFLGGYNIGERRWYYGAYAGWKLFF